MRPTLVHTCRIDASAFDFCSAVVPASKIPATDSEVDHVIEDQTKDSSYAPSNEDAYLSALAHDRSRVERKCCRRTHVMPFRKSNTTIGIKTRTYIAIIVPSVCQLMCFPNEGANSKLVFYRSE